MPRKSPYAIILTADEEYQLQSIARRYTSPYRDVVRAKVILLVSQGFENEQIGRRLDLPRQIVSKWRKRFFEQRLDGLEDRSRRGRPREFSPSDRHGG
ncbi:MAG: helix-turn-helix domain-containing protein [bacterium]